MAYHFEELSRTFGRYFLVPGYSFAQCVPTVVSLKTPPMRSRKGEEQYPIEINIPTVSAIMQSVSGDKFVIALAKQGGVFFIRGSQSVEDEADMARRVKQYKKGLVTPDSSLSPTATPADVFELKNEIGYSTAAITDDGTARGKLLGIAASRDYRLSRMPMDLSVKEFMTPFEHLVTTPASTNLRDCNDTIWDNRINSPLLVDDGGRLQYMVFRKSYDSYKENVNEPLGENKSCVVGAGISTCDYETRVPALVKVGVDVLCIDSLEGYSEWQERIISWIRANYGDHIKVGTGNVMGREDFLFLVKIGADFVKAGIDGGSICITRKTKGIGRGQAMAVIEVVKARDDYFKQTGIYVPVYSDGGIVHDYHITLALAMDADFVILGRYFARFDESPTAEFRINSSYVREYWGKGSNRAWNWQCYDLDDTQKLSFEEDVDNYVPYTGTLVEGVQTTLHKVRSIMCSCGVPSIEELREKARLTVVPSTSVVEGGDHDVILRNNNQTN